MKYLCDRCTQRNFCDGPKWCLGFIDYKDVKANDVVKEEYKESDNE